MTHHLAHRVRPASARLSRPCPHCDRDRVEIQLGQLAAVQRRTPLPGFDRTLTLLLDLYPASRVVFVCTSCICVTADPGRHEHR